MRLSIVFSMLLFASCGLTDPSDDLTGIWNARSVGHSDVLSMTLRQSGDVITGTACEWNGMLLFKDVPVRGDYPNLEFTVTAAQAEQCCALIAGRTFRGKQDGSMDIVGSYGGIDLRFERATASLCP